MPKATKQPLEEKPHRAQHTAAPAIRHDKRPKPKGGMYDTNRNAAIEIIAKITAQRAATQAPNAPLSGDNTFVIPSRETAIFLKNKVRAAEQPTEPSVVTKALEARLARARTAEGHLDGIFGNESRTGAAPAASVPEAPPGKSEPPIAKPCIL